MDWGAVRGRSNSGRSCVCLEGVSEPYMDQERTEFPAPRHSIHGAPLSMEPRAAKYGEDKGVFTHAQRHEEEV